MRTTLTSKGQLTLPVEVRKKLGLEQGTQFEVSVNEAGQVVMTPLRSEENPFRAWIGAFGRLPDGMTAVEWVRELRSEEE
ncbi:type II toxin-antitoxin system MazE family antitoxin [Deinococcus aluminii]|uniref:SpoVT-AbrB domain-containing protein n=1 Tax=Deinococcus aluminii TaxID=1656885 RepID=A0ABP9XC21_9DEIO